jgi:seryl-tRNA synthetase
MLDIKWIREHPNLLDQSLQRRCQQPLSVDILRLDSKRREAQTRLQEAQNERNDMAQLIAQTKRQQGILDPEITQKAASLKGLISALEEEERLYADQLYALLSGLPNILDNEVPEGKDASYNFEIKKWGNPRDFDFEPLSHDELGEKRGLMDFESATKISGARFVVLKGTLARLERALAHFMLDVHTQEFGYQEVSPPLLVRDEAAYGVGQLPKFKEDLFQTTDGRWLISTAEVSLTNLVRETILEEKILPLRFTAFTPCFRSEAGAAGRDTRGMIRQHQFQKVELVSIVHPEKSEEEHQRMLQAVETILQRLQLPYRIMLLSSGDTGHASCRTYDFEVWLPSEQTYREISSCSNCRSYQARRMQARFRRKEAPSQKNVTDFVHTLNGSGVAVGRALIALLENHQDKDGSILIPKALQPYMKGMERISFDD